MVVGVGCGLVGCGLVGCGLVGFKRQVGEVIGLVSPQPPGAEDGSSEDKEGQEEADEGGHLNPSLGCDAAEHGTWRVAGGGGALAAGAGHHTRLIIG